MDCFVTKAYWNWWCFTSHCSQPARESDLWFLYIRLSIYFIFFTVIEREKHHFSKRYCLNWCFGHSGEENLPVQKQLCLGLVAV